MGSFDELRPIKKQLLLDFITLSALFYNAFSQYSIWKLSALICIILVSLHVRGLTARWTVIFPLIPYLIIYTSRIIFFPNWNMILTIILIMIVMISVFLTFLFPAVELPPVKGKYHVGVVDFYLPVTSNNDDKDNCDPSNFVSVRLLYPTNQITTKTIPFLNPALGKAICRVFMMNGPPPPLQGLGFILHYWLLICIGAQRNALPLESNADSKDGKFPMAVFSHGLLGIPDIYSYQGFSLASNGTVVLMVTHSDGSAPVMRQKDGRLITYEYAARFRNEHKDRVGTVRKWRHSTMLRSEEYLKATKAFLSLNQTNIEPLQSFGISFVDKLNTKDMTFLGHSFGGGTALHAAYVNPDIVSRVAVFDPCCAWLPDESRRAFFISCDGKENDENHECSVYDGGLGGYETDVRKHKKNEMNFKKMDLLCLFSHEWVSNRTGHSDYVEYMAKRETLGKPDGVSDFSLVNGSHHQEFSDTCCLIPPWIARPTGSTGNRSPLDTLEESAEQIQQFLNDSRTTVVVAKSRGLKFGRLW